MAAVAASVRRHNLLSSTDEKRRHQRKLQHHKFRWTCRRGCFLGIVGVGAIALLAVRILLYVATVLPDSVKKPPAPSFSKNLDKVVSGSGLHGLNVEKWKTDSLIQRSHPNIRSNGRPGEGSFLAKNVTSRKKRSKRLAKPVFWKNEGAQKHQGPGAIQGEPYFEPEVLGRDFKKMMDKMKIFVYPHKKGDPYRNIVEAVNYEPTGNYASESYFKKALLRSSFVTDDPSQADLFYMPFSIARARNDRRIGVNGLQDFVRDYVAGVIQKWPYWNRTGGADHFYLSCHSVSRDVMKKAEHVRANAIQLVCSSSYYLQGYISHKDASVPQIWPRRSHAKGAELVKQRNTLAFFAGSANSPVRAAVVQAWSNDSDIKVHGSRIKTPYSIALLTSRFCLHVKGFEVNTARIADAIYYGCIPLIIANHYDLPFADILDWRKFSVILATADIPLLKKTLHDITEDQYRRLQKNVMNVRKHFLWHDPPQAYDAFYMIMYELWLRRHVLRYPL